MCGLFVNHAPHPDGERLFIVALWLKDNEPALTLVLILMKHSFVRPRVDG
jgi:hypothetical protein